MSETPVANARRGELLHRCRPSHGLSETVGAEHGLRWISYGTLRLDEGESFAASTDGDEVTLVVLGGRCDVEADKVRWEAVGGRKDVFSGSPHAVYVPPAAGFSVTAAGGAVEVAVCRVAARAERPRTVARLIQPEDMRHESRGANHWRRGIIDVVDQDFAADRIIIVEVMTPPGHWSSFPPHRHEVDDPPGEVDMEEIYYYRTDNPAGFGLQAVYTDDRAIDDAYIVRDHDVLVIPRGYHPVAAAPSSSLWYLCVLAGDRRLMAPRDEPENAWFRVAERLLT
jgi:5-deoxy-glucuronate isomerase